VTGSAARKRGANYWWQGRQLGALRRTRRRRVRMSMRIKPVLSVLAVYPAWDFSGLESRSGRSGDGKQRRADVA